MPRIAPDFFDQIVWPLTETSGPYRNVGQFSPNDSSTDLTVNNSVIRTGAGLFTGNSIELPGTSNVVSGSSSTRNGIYGANLFIPSAPVTISCWVYLYSYSTSQNQTIIAKEFRDPSMVGTWTAPFNSFCIATTTGNGGGDWFIQTAINTTTQTVITFTDFPIPLGIWSHIGMTHDGTRLRGYLNGCPMMTYSGSTQNLSFAATGPTYTDGVNGYGPWRVGAIRNTGSTNKEEGNMNVQDVRIANIVRPLAYFKKIYSAGVLPISNGQSTNGQVYKLRAYDLACSTPTPVIWTDTEISLANAPAFPCGGPYTAPEVLDTWYT